MALILITIELYNQDWAADLLHSSFDSVHIVQRRPNNMLVLDIQDPEVPAENIFINPIAYAFEGVKPFFIDFGIPEDFKPLE